MLSLLYGIAVNLTMIGIALVLAALYVGWVHVRLQSFCDPPALRSSATCLGNGEPATWQLPRWSLDRAGACWCWRWAGSR